MNTSGGVLHGRIAQGATVIVVTVMFYAIVWLSPFLRMLSLPYAAGLSIAGAIASLAFYKLVAEKLLSLFKNVRPLRRIALGGYFLEGTWVGHWVSHGQHYFTLEYIDQSSGETKIVGRQFDENGVTLASWASDTVSIDLDRKQLVYAYTCKVFHRKHVHEGIGVFTIVMEVPGQPACKLDGYAVDLVDGNRDPNVEWKICDREVTDVAALEKARQIFNVPSANVSSKPAVAAP